MAIQDPKELFVKLLSDVRQNEEKTTNALQELSEAVEDMDIKEAIESRIFLKNQTLSTLDRCFDLIDEKPQKPGGWKPSPEITFARTSAWSKSSAPFFP